MAAFKFRKGSRTDHRYFVLLHTALPPEAADWDAYVEGIAQALMLANGTVHAFVASDGGGPTAAQRQKLAQAFTRGDAATHLFTSDPVPRGIVTAFAWVSRAQVKAHAPQEFPTVCHALGISPSEVAQDFAFAQDGFPRVRALDQLHAAVKLDARGKSLRPRAQ
jgi:hypothetical protein